MNIIERCCIGKNKNRELNEDALVVTDRYIAVIDGATSCASDWGKPGGLIAKELLEAYILSAEQQTDGFVFIQALNNVLYEAQKNEPELFSSPEKRLMASVAVFSVSNKQLWSYGDCQYSINGRYFCFDKTVDQMNAMVRSFIDRYHLQNGSDEKTLQNNDIGAEFLSPMLKMQPQFANKDCEFGYPILDGGTLCKKFFCSHCLSDGDTVIMASDGYPCLCDTLSQSESLLEDMKESDPLCIGQYKSVKGFYPGLNGFDDRTYIKFTV